MSGAIQFDCDDEQSQEEPDHAGRHSQTPQLQLAWSIPPHSKPLILKIQIYY